MPTTALVTSAAAAEPPVADIAAATVQICPACINSAGLCAACAEHDRSLLPQLKEPGWYRLVGSGMYHEAQVAAREESAAAKKAKRRNDKKERKARVRRAELVHAGGFDRPADHRAVA